MTKQEELTYLFGILSEASKWASSQDDPDSVRVEVEYRIRNLISGAVPEHDNLPAEEENLTGAICAKESIADVRPPSHGVEITSILANVCLASARRLSILR